MNKRGGIYEKIIKRPLDCILAIFALFIFSPLILITALIVKFKIGSPIIFSQDRPGRRSLPNGEECIFKLYKFRTMTNEKDSEGNYLSDEVRLTKIGRLLRSTSLDELPELINIIKGDMSIVGPRPLLVKYLPWYTEEQRHRHDVRPGLTGYAQAHGRNAISWDEKFELDLKYVSNITFIGDLKIILDTVKAVLKREGISSETSVTMESFIDYCKSQGRKPTE